ncbi:MAG: CDP-alcohol phosphatidyltransferase family protein [Chloroflexi bacterium]|nr:CDP-alcohol phosphatidyltransferase family protein [Chloroflexota bacterium]
MRAPRLQVRAWAARFVVEPPARLLLALHIHPNAITAAGFAVAVGAAYLLAEGLLWQGGIVMLAGAALDMYDGAVARLGGKESTFGAMLDSVLDRLGEIVVLFGLLVFYVRGADDVGAYLAFGALAASLMVSYLRARSEGLGVPGDVGLMGRPERIVVLGAGLLLGYPAWALGIIAALGSLTVVQRAVHVWRAGRRA